MEERVHVSGEGIERGKMKHIRHRKAKIK